MLRMFLKMLAVPVLVVLVLAGALFAYMLHGERSAKELATSFCDAVRVGDNPDVVQSRAAASQAMPSSFTWTPTVAQIGPQSVTVRVTDNGTPALFAEQVVSITVSSANQAPVAVDAVVRPAESPSPQSVNRWDERCLSCRSCPGHWRSVDRRRWTG